MIKLKQSVYNVGVAWYKRGRQSFCAKIFLVFLIIPALPQAITKTLTIYEKPLQERGRHSEQILTLATTVNQNHMRLADPYSYEANFSTQELEKKERILNKCAGRKNLVNDIGILGLIWGVISATLGMYTLVYNSITSNNLGIISGVTNVILWIPTVVFPAFYKEGSFIYHLSNWINGASFFNDMLGFTGIWYGMWDVITSFAGEVVGFIGMGLSIIATFPDFLDGLIELAYVVGNRKKLEYVVDNYGCVIPSMLTFMGEHLHDILDRLLINSTKRVRVALEKLGYRH